MLTYHQTTEAEKYRITAWEYEGEYAIYNATPYAEQKKKALALPIRSIISIPFTQGKNWLALSICTRRKPKSSSASALHRPIAAKAMAGR